MNPFNSKDPIPLDAPHWALADAAAMRIVPICISIRDLQEYIRLLYPQRVRQIAKGWGDLLLWCWRHPQNPGLN